MMRPGGRSLKRKLMTAILLTSGIVLLLTCGALLTYEVVTFRRAMVQGLQTVARVIAANSTAALAFDSPEDAVDVLAALAAEPHIVSAAIYDADDVLFAAYPRDHIPAPLPSAPSAARFEADALVLSQPVVTGSRRLGTLYLRSDLGAMAERFRLYGTVVVGVVFLAGVVAVVLSAKVQAYISEPVLALADTARIVIRDRDYSVRAPRSTDDELGELASAFNSMLGYVQEQDRSLRHQEEQLRQEIARRTQAEDDVRALNADLERRVADRTAELESANKELESFSYSVSHDLRAPLRHILGYVDLLQTALAGQLSDRTQRYVLTIQKASTEMGQLIDDLLTFSRTTRSEMRRMTVHLDAAVHAILQGVECPPERHIEWHIAPLPAVVGDPVLLRQVLANLLDNAVKYTRPRDPATITIGCGDAEDGQAVVFVRDNGVGFDPAYAHKLFGVFQRLHRSDEFEGTGIGLATVQRIIARHGGRVWAESQVGLGSTFYFSLPLAEPAPSPPMVAREEP